MLKCSDKIKLFFMARCFIAFKQSQAGLQTKPSCKFCLKCTVLCTFESRCYSLKFFILTTKRQRRKKLTTFEVVKFSRQSSFYVLCDNKKVYQIKFKCNFCFRKFNNRMLFLIFMQLFWIVLIEPKYDLPRIVS